MMGDRRYLASDALAGHASARAPDGPLQACSLSRSDGESLTLAASLAELVKIDVHRNDVVPIRQ